MPTPAEISALNNAIVEQLDSGHEKQAADAVNDFIRTRMREDGFFRKILPPVTITSDELDRRIEDVKPSKVIDKEPGSPAAVTVGFNTAPIQFYIKQRRFRINFARILTPKAVKDVDELRTDHADVRQIISDNMLKDALAEEDSKWILACNAAMLGADTPVPANENVIQWETITGGITRETCLESLKIMPKGPSHLEVNTILMNNVTIYEVMKWGRDEIGGDMSQDIFKNGWVEATFFGRRLLITIKRDLVPDNSFLMYADPKFIGRFFELEPMTLYIKKEAFMVEFFSYETIGAGIGHTGGLARADFT